MAGKTILWAVATTAWCVLLAATSRGETMVGVIMSGNTPYYQDIHTAFEENLRSQGVEAQIVVQKPGTDAMAWRNAARKLVAIECNVIVTYGAPATLTAMKETSSIPIVFGAVFDPPALNIGGKNATGIASGVPIPGVVKNLRTVANFSRLGVIYNTDEEDTVLQLQELKSIGAKQGYETVGFDVKDATSPGSLNQVDALFLTTSCAAMHCVQNFVGIARQNRIPTASTTGGGENSGIVLTITADPREQGTTVASMVAKILGGEKPSALAVEQPKKVNFILNLKEARAVGLKIPFSVMTSATQVIQ